MSTTEHPEAPVLNIRRRKVPALDGLRALAVLAVLTYHLDLPWARGGYLGVDLFFVLSGFLITSLLLEEHLDVGRIAAPAFWGRRARRLLPALFILLIGVMVAAALVDRAARGAAPPINMPGLRGDAIATLLYVANWHFIATGQSYFAQFTNQLPSLLEHTWSLSIEEQFYVVWPPVVLLVLRFARGGWRRAGLVLAAVGALASSLVMALVYLPANPMRAYFGTDSHAMGLLAGACLAFATAGVTQGQRYRPAIKLGGWLGLAGLFVGIGVAGTAKQLPQPWMFRGGFLAFALLGVLLIMEARQHEASALGKLLSLRPLRYIGAISYGVYLYHWPIFVLMTKERMGYGGFWLGATKVASTFAVAIVSFHLIERPLRHASYRGWRRALLPAAVGVVVAAIVICALPSVYGAPKASKKAVAPTRSATAPGVGGFADQVPIALGFTPSAARPLKVLSFGDSVIETAQPAIGSALAATGASEYTPAAFPGWGTTTDPLWRDHLSSWMERFKPDLVVASWNWDGKLAVEQPETYRATLESVVQLVTSGPNAAKGLVFLQDPTFGPSQVPGAKPHPQSFGDDPALAAWNRIAREVVKAMPGKAMWFPLAPSVLLKGQFTYWLPAGEDYAAPLKDWSRVRMIDGIHFCPSGAARYASAFTTDLHQLFGLPLPRGRWWEGLWTLSPVFQQEGVVACPDDHPTTRPSGATSPAN